MGDMTSQDGHQDSTVLKRSSQRAEGHVHSSVGKFILTEMLSRQKLLYIITVDCLTTQNGHQDSAVLQRSSQRAHNSCLMTLDDA